MEKNIKKIFLTILFFSFFLFIGHQVWANPTSTPPDLGSGTGNNEMFIYFYSLLIIVGSLVGTCLIWIFAFMVNTFVSLGAAMFGNANKKKNI